MFRHTSQLQFEAKPDKPDPVYARKLQELIGGAYGEMTVALQYLFQGWNCRVPGKYKDLIMDTATEEIGHVEMIATMVARLLEGAPATATTKAAADPVVGAVLGGMDPQQAIVGGGGPLPSDSNGHPWNGRYIVASGNLLADFQANAAAEAQGRLQSARLFNMTDDPGVRAMLRFNLARDTVHQRQWLAAIEELQVDGLEPSPIAPNTLFDEEEAGEAYSIWHLSDGDAAEQGGWIGATTPTGDPVTFLENPAPLGGVASPPPPDPRLLDTYDGSLGEPAEPAMGTETGPIGKIKNKLS
jgi:Mn-containing catalase